MLSNYYLNKTISCFIILLHYCLFHYLLFQPNILLIVTILMHLVHAIMQDMVIVFVYNLLILLTIDYLHYHWLITIVNYSDLNYYFPKHHNHNNLNLSNFLIHIHYYYNSNSMLNMYFALLEMNYMDVHNYFTIECNIQIPFLT